LKEVREVAVGFGIITWDGRVLETFGFGERAELEVLFAEVENARGGISQ